MTHIEAAEIIHKGILVNKQKLSLTPKNWYEKNPAAKQLPRTIEALELARDTLLQIPAFEKKLEKLELYENAYPDAFIGDDDEPDEEKP